MGESVSNKYALVQDGVVINICLWDGNPSSWRPDPGIDAIPVPENVLVSIGWAYDDGVFSPT